MLYYEITAYICDPQPGELQQGYTHTSGPIYIVENGVHREVEVNDCFWSRARSAHTVQNPSGHVMSHNVKWKTVSRQWNTAYNSSNAGPRQHAVCCDYWLCSGELHGYLCTHHLGLPLLGSWPSENDCLTHCVPPQRAPNINIDQMLTVFIGNEPCLDVRLCPCGWDYHVPGSFSIAGWPWGACTSPDFHPFLDLGDSQITGPSEFKCITIDGVLPSLNDAIPLITGGGIAPGVTISSGPVGTANGGYITHDSSYVVKKYPPAHQNITPWNSVICNSMFPYNPYAPTPQNKKIINSFVIDDNALHETGAKRLFTVSGDIGAIFSLTVKNSAGKYYNFTTNAFQTAAVKLAQQEIDFTGNFNSGIIFPTVTSNDTYDIEFFSEVGRNTFLSKDAITNSRANVSTSNELTLIKTITQSVNTTITFSLRSPSNSAYYSTLPASVTSTLTPLANLSSGGKVDFSWDVTLSSRNFSLTRQPVLTDFETDKSDIYTTDGTGSSIVALILDDVSRLETGMALTAVESGSVSGSPVINSINITTKTVTLSVAQSWADDKEITFTDTGHNGFRNFYDSSSFLVRPTATIADVTTTTSGVVTASADIAVTSPNGLKASITQTVNDAVKESTTVILDSITGCWIGQYLVNISSGMVNAAIKITGINTSTKTVTFDTALTIADGITLTFANTTVEGIDIIVNSDYPAVPIYISNIVGSDLTVNAIQTLASGITLTFKGNSRSATITGTMTVEGIGATDFTTYLNLDNILYVTA